MVRMQGRFTAGQIDDTTKLFPGQNVYSTFKVSKTHNPFPSVITECRAGRTEKIAPPQNAKGYLGVTPGINHPDGVIGLF
jgi:hypothetical protein